MTGGGTGPLALCHSLRPRAPGPASVLDLLHPDEAYVEFRRVARLLFGERAAAMLAVPRGQRRERE